MSSNYPGSIDAFPTNHADDVGEIIHAATVNDLADAANKIETELGANPKGGEATVKARLDGGVSPGAGNSGTVNANAANTYIVGLPVTYAGGTSRLKAGSFLRWTGSMTKTAAGTAGPIFTIVVGTAGTTADTARVTMTGVAQTAATDTGFFTLDISVFNAGASGVLQGTLRFSHANTTTGLANQAQEQILQNQSATFDLTVANLKMGLCVNPGASGNWTFQNATVHAFNLNV